jgi:hypothetical protein
MYDVDTFIKQYPEWYNPDSTRNIIMFFILFSLLFIIPYIYIRFFEVKVISLINNIKLKLLENISKLKQMKH